MTTTQDAPSFPRIPPAALAAAAFGAQLALRGRQPARRSTTLLAGGLVLGAGWFGLGAVVRFRARGTTVDPVDVGGTALVVDGPNSVTRNPMYVGLAVGLVAHAVHRRALRGLLPVAGFVAAIDRLQIPVEEAVLRERFGDEYERYVATTPRWLGLPRPAPERRRSVAQEPDDRHPGPRRRGAA